MPPIRHSKPKTASIKRKYIHNHEPCPVCGVVIQYRCDIARHQRQHAENREELMTPCPWPDCSYKSLQRSNITLHARNKHKWNIHHCQPTCKFSAVLKKDLAQHQQEVHGIECTTTEWEEEGPIEPDDVPPKSRKKNRNDASPSSIPEEPAAALSPPSSSSSNDRHISSNCAARLLWNQQQIFKKLEELSLSSTVLNPSFLQVQQQQRPAQRQQPQSSWNPVVWNTIPTQDRSNLPFSFENPSSSFIPTQQTRRPPQIWNRGLNYPPPTVHNPSTIPGQALGRLPFPFETMPSSSMPAQEQIQRTRNTAVENVPYSRLPMYRSYAELQEQQQQQQQQFTWNRVIENTAAPEANAGFTALASDMNANLDALSGMEHLSSWDNMTFPIGVNVGYDTAPPSTSLDENSALGLYF